jgi:hypothetical protein
MQPAAAFNADDDDGAAVSSIEVGRDNDATIAVLASADANDGGCAASDDDALIADSLSVAAPVMSSASAAEERLDRLERAVRYAPSSIRPLLAADSRRIPPPKIRGAADAACRIGRVTEETLHERLSSVLVAVVAATQ